MPRIINLSIQELSAIYPVETSDAIAITYAENDDPVLEQQVKRLVASINRLERKKHIYINFGPANAAEVLARIGCAINTLIELGFSQEQALKYLANVPLRDIT